MSATSVPATRPSRVLLAGFALVALHLGYRAYGFANSWFTIDDFNFISIMRENRPLLDRVFTNYFGHRMPGAFYLSGLNDQLAPWQWWLPASELFVMQALVSIGLLLLLFQHMGGRWGILAPLAIYLFTASSVPPTIWWAAGINLLPLSVALVWSTYFHLWYLRTHRKRHVLAVCIVLAFGLVFNEKTLLTFGALALVSIAWFAEGSTLLSRIKFSFNAYRVGVLSYTLLFITYLGIYLATTSVEGLPKIPVIGRFPIMEVVWNLAFNGYLSALAGGPWTWRHFHNSSAQIAMPGTGAILGAFVLACYILWTTKRAFTGWARALLLPAYFLVANMVLVSYARVAFVGPALTLEYRYQGEMALVTAIGLAAMVMPWRNALAGPTRRHDAPKSFFDQPRLVFALVGAVCISGVWSGTQFIQHWGNYTSQRTYTRAMVEQLKHHPSSDPIADVVVPISLTNSLRYPENLLRKVFVKESRGLTFQRWGIDHLTYPYANGKLAEISVPNVRSALASEARGCGYRIKSGRQIPLDGPVGYAGFWIAMDYQSANGASVVVGAGDQSYVLDLPPGSHTLYAMAGDNFDEVSVALRSSSARMCVTRLVTGPVEIVDLV
ncbi:MAG: hypothetical protein V9E81_02635 [Marmoricola sp.]